MTVCFRWSAALLAIAVGGCIENGGATATSERTRCGDCSFVLISIDTLRADHLGTYGYPRATSPRIDAFARDGILFEQAYGASFHTADSHMSMFTGVLPTVHRVRNWEEGRSEPPLSPRIATLAERLSAAGFETIGFHGGGNVAGEYGFRRGFDRYEPTAGHDLALARDWIDQRRGRKAGRFLLFVHTYRPHDPYLPDPPFDGLWSVPGGDEPRRVLAELRAAGDAIPFAERRRRFWEVVDPRKPEQIASIIGLYDGEVRQTDAEIGELLDRIDRLEERVVVFIVSDHGEEFFEHGKFKHDDVFEETLRVPWIVRLPGRTNRGTRIPERVSLVDLAPTALELLELPAHERGLDGRSLAGAIRDLERVTARPILAEKIVSPDLDDASPFALKQALVVGDEKLHQRPSSAQLLFDLEADPGERVDLSGARPERFERLATLLATWNRAKRRKAGGTPNDAADVELDAETVEQLRALGYLD